MKNRHGPKGGRGSSVYRCSRRGDERVVRTGAEIAESNGGNSDDSRDDNDDDDDDDNGHKSGEKCATKLMTEDILNLTCCDSCTLATADNLKVGPEMMTVNIAMWEFSQNDAKR